MNRSFPSLGIGAGLGASTATSINQTAQYAQRQTTNDGGNYVRNDSNVLLLYAGGTIGMKNGPGGYACEPDYFENKLRGMQQFHDPECPSIIGPDGNEMLIMPVSIFGKRVRYRLLEYSPLYDSCNMQMTDWSRIAQDIAKWYAHYDSFIIIHGTDTMAYTASALSFMLENLGKTVIITGSQVPLAEIRNDAVNNLLGALTIAGHFIIPEVCLYFHNKLLRGNRAVKESAVDFDAFKSPNFDALVKVGINIDVEWDAVFYPNTIERFSVFTNMNANVATVRLFPGITESTVRAFLQPPIQGVVLETYGAGNAPDTRKDLLSALKDAVDRGVVIVNCTQCARGLVTDAYATGKALSVIGIVPGSDMTTVCALTKLSYLLGKGESPSWIRDQIRKSLRGELTVVSLKPRFSLLDEKFVQTVAKALKASSKAETDMIAKALNPVLLCSAAASGDVKGLESILDADGSPNSSDYDHRTPLHLAASEGQFETAKILIMRGASVHSKDRFGTTPLFEAVQNKHDQVIALLRQAGAALGLAPTQLSSLACAAAARGDVGLISRLLDCDADLTVGDYDKRTPLHLAASEGHIEIVKLLLKAGGKKDVVDRWGMTPRDEAEKRGNSEIVALLS